MQLRNIFPAGNPLIFVIGKEHDRYAENQEGGEKYACFFIEGAIVNGLIPDSDSSPEADEENYNSADPLFEWECHC